MTFNLVKGFFLLFLFIYFFHPHVSMENKLEENIKGEKKEFTYRKGPKRTYRSPGDVNELVGAPLQQQDLLLGAHQDA